MVLFDVLSGREHWCLGLVHQFYLAFVFVLGQVEFFLELAVQFVVVCGRSFAHEPGRVQPR